MSSSSSSTTTTTTPIFTSSSILSYNLLDHYFPPSHHICYVHCYFCDSVLAVSVPCTSLFKRSVSVRCGHCTNLVPLNLLLPYCSSNQFHSLNNLPEEMQKPSPNFLVKQSNSSPNHQYFSKATSINPRAFSHHDPPILKTPPGKRQKVPSAYNRFIKEEIQRIKSENPSITHREAFSAAAKNWAHFPHINFGVNIPDHALKKTDQQPQEG